MNKPDTYMIIAHGCIYRNMQHRHSSQSRNPNFVPKTRFKIAHWDTIKT